MRGFEAGFADSHAMELVHELGTTPQTAPDQQVIAGGSGVS
jgi:hypothetical protein